MYDIDDFYLNRITCIKKVALSQLLDSNGENKAETQEKKPLCALH
jgi:hypothetical protein